MKWFSWLPIVLGLMCPQISSAIEQKNYDNIVFIKLKKGVENEDVNRLITSLNLEILSENAGFEAKFLTTPPGEARKYIDLLNQSPLIRYANSVYYHPEISQAHYGTFGDIIRIRFKESESEASINRIISDVGGNSIRHLPGMPEYREVQIDNPKVEDIHHIAAQYAGDFRVRYAFPDRIYWTPDALGTAPDDPKYEDDTQWYLEQIDAAKAWDLSTGSSSVKIAIFDTGIDQDHEDLEDNLVGSSDRYDAVDDDNSPDDNGEAHGTRVSGVASATTNNDLGIAGMGWNCSIMPVRVRDDPWSSIAILSRGLAHAREHGANVINISMWWVQSDSLDTELEETYNDGITIVAITHNSNQTPIYYPASSPYVIAVGGSDKDDHRWREGSYGSNYGGGGNGNGVDLVAPATDIHTTDLSSSYTNPNLAGTSVAAPQVAGVVGLMYSVNANLSPAEVRQLLARTAEKVGGYDYDTPQEHGYWNNEMGYGRLNAYKALSAAKPVTVLTAEPQKQSIRLTWTKVSGVSDYFVRFGTDTTTTDSWGVVDSSQSSYTASTLQNGTQYYFRVNGSDLFTNIPSNCRTDYSGSSVIDFADWLLFAQHWQTSVGDQGYEQKYDLSGNRTVDYPDSTIFVGDYNKSCDQVPKPAVRPILANGKNRTARPQLAIRQSEGIIEADVQLQGATELVGHEVVLQYDPDILEYVGYTDAAGMLRLQDADGAMGFAKNERGVVILVSSVKPKQAAAAGSGLLVTARFVRTGAYTGEPPISLYEVSLADRDLTIDRPIVQGVAAEKPAGFDAQLETALQQNNPNPFNLSTVIPFSLAEAAPVHLTIYNALGQEVRWLIAGVQMNAGMHKVVWDGKDALGRLVSSGVYMYEMKAGDFRTIRRMLLLK